MCIRDSNYITWVFVVLYLRCRHAFTHLHGRISKDGMTIMFGGFVGCGTAHHIVKEIVKSGAKDLTLICNDPGKIFVDADGNQDFYGISQLFITGQVKKFIASHIGIVREVGAAMNAGTLEVDLVPQVCPGKKPQRFYCPSPTSRKNRRFKRY